MGDPALSCRVVTTEKATLDGLRIDRSAQTTAGGGGSRVLWIVLFLLLIGGALAATWWWLGRAEDATVVTAVARQGQEGAATTVLNATGYVTARRQATVSSKVAGKIVEVLIEEGLEVEEDQVLARLDAVNVRKSLELARAQLAAAKAAVEETEVRLAQAELDLGRAERLVREKVSSQAELDRARTEVDANRARLVRQREDIAVAARQVAIFEQQIADTVIRAPFAGVIVAKNAQPGEMISPNSAGGGFTRTGIGTVVDMASLEIEVDVNEQYINRVRADQPVEAVLDAYPSWKIPAHVIAIIPTADRQRATVRVRIGFEELDPRILPDMGVKVAFREEVVEPETTAAPRVIVPARAVRREGDKRVVFVVKEGQAERRAVRVADGEAGEAIVLAGVRAGERVVVEGPEELEDGMAVREEER